MSKKWRNIVGIPLMGFAVASTIGVSSVAADYYASITNTTNGTTLASSLHTLSQNKHTTTLSYSGLWGGICYNRYIAWNKHHLGYLFRLCL